MQGLKNVAVFNWGWQHRVAIWYVKNVQKAALGLKTIIPMAAQTIPNFLIIRMEQWSTIHILAADMQMGLMHYYIAENRTIFCRHIDNKCYYEVKTYG